MRKAVSRGLNIIILCEKLLTQAQHDAIMTVVLTGVLLARSYYAAVGK